MTANAALGLATTLQEAKEKAEEFFNPFIEKWLDHLLALERIDEDQHDQDFHFDFVNEEGIHFTCPPYESHEYKTSYWRYEHDITIPFDFFDDSTKYDEEVRKYRETKAHLAEQRALREKVARVANLEAALRKAREEAGL